jgi:hypothetical protein
VKWRLSRLAGPLFLLLAGHAGPARAQLSWTDWADLALAAPAVLVADLRGIDRLDRKAAPDVPPGEVRALVTADVRSVLKAPGLFPAGAAWLWQGPADGRGRAPLAKAMPVLLFAAPMPGGARPEVQALRLVAPHGQQPWRAADEDVVRRILRAAQAGGAPMVTGVSDAARTSGDVEGDSESQIFLTTEAGMPMTMLVRRSSGAAPRLEVATGDLVSNAAPVERETLLWRGLACGLPPALPPQLAADAGLVADYAFALDTLGPCGRTQVPPSR